MKARIKATGEIVDLAPYTRVYEDFAKGRSWLVEELDDADDIPDYWTRLEHTYAGMAMQGIMANSLFMPYDGKEIADISNDIATALVQKLKEKEEEK